MITVFLYTETALCEIIIKSGLRVVIKRIYEMREKRVASILTFNCEFPLSYDSRLRDYEVAHKRIWQKSTKIHFVIIPAYMTKWRKETDAERPPQITRDDFCVRVRARETRGTRRCYAACYGIFF